MSMVDPGKARWPIVLAFACLGSLDCSCDGGATATAAEMTAPRATKTETVPLQAKVLMNMTVCTSKCVNDGGLEDCKTYITPMHRCFNPRSMFGSDDPTWSDANVLDIVDASSTMPTLSSQSASIHVGASPSSAQNQEETFHRYLYATDDVLCKSDPTDVFILPLDICVGPFGEPRPWGEFHLLSITDRGSDAGSPT